MENDFSLEDRENFRIDPAVWLHTLLAITGDKDKKAEVVELLVQKTGFPPGTVELIITTTINILMNEIRSN